MATKPSVNFAPFTMTLQILCQNLVSVLCIQASLENTALRSLTKQINSNWENYQVVLYSSKDLLLDFDIFRSVRFVVYDIPISQIPQCTNCRHLPIYQTVIFALHENYSNHFISNLRTAFALYTIHPQTLFVHLARTQLTTTMANVLKLPCL